MQETQAWSQIREDPTCHGATKLMQKTTEPVLWSPEAPTTDARAPRACAPQQWEAHAP